MDERHPGFLDTAAFNMEVDPFIRRFLLEARAAQHPDDAYPIVVPQPLSFPDVVTAGWSEAGIILPHGLWRHYGGTAVIDENWAAMEQWMAEMAQASGRAADAAHYKALRAASGMALAAELLDGAGKAGNGSQCSQVLALHMGLVPADQQVQAAQILAQDIRARGMTLSTGFLGTPYLLDVLADAGVRDEVIGLLLQTRYPSWGYMPSVGATTVWERWNGDVGDLSHLTLSVPANCTARISLPARVWREGSRAVEEHPDIPVHATTPEGVTIEVGSGRYHFIRDRPMT